MSSPNGKMEVEASSAHKSSRNHSSETHRTRRSHRSRSRSRDHRGSRHDRPDEDRRRRSDRSRERRERSHRERSHRERDRDREPRDGEHDRPRDRDRRKEREEDRYRERERERERSSRHSHREKDRDPLLDEERRDRRRKRGEEPEDPDTREYDDHHKRRRDSISEKSVPPPPSAGLPPPPLPPPPPPPPPRDDGRRTRSRESERRVSRGPRDARDEFGDGMRLASRDNRDYDHEPRSPRPPSPLEDDAPPSPPGMSRPSPTYNMDAPDDEFREDDSEARSVFVSQLAARMTARDLGYFFEDKLGEGSVMDSRIVTDRLSRRSKGIAYVEFRGVDLVDKAITLSGTIVMGLPIMIQHTESERNKTHAGDASLNLPPGVNGRGGTLYVGSLHFNLTEADIKQVFEPFGELDFVDLHRDPMTGRSKGYAFLQYRRAEDAKMALEQMEGFELAGRTLRVNTVHEKGSVKYTQQDSLEENGGANLNAASRQALMQKLARIDTPPTITSTVNKPNIPQAMTSRSVLLRNMFTPDEETEPDWDKDLAEDVKGECETKYGNVQYVKVERDSDGEIYLQFDTIDSAKKAIEGLNGRYFAGRPISAAFISDAIMQAHR